MKRIISACLEQTIHFQLKDGVEEGYAKKCAVYDYENYKKHMDRSNVRYDIIEEKIQDDGSIIVKIKKQYNSYKYDGYMD